MVVDFTSAATIGLLETAATSGPGSLMLCFG